MFLHLRCGEATDNGASDGQALHDEGHLTDGVGLQGEPYLHDHPLRCLDEDIQVSEVPLHTANISHSPTAGGRC